MEKDDFSKIADKIHKDNFSRWHNESDMKNAKYIRERFDVFDYEKILAEITNKIYSSELKRTLLKEYARAKEKNIKELKQCIYNFDEKIKAMIEKEKCNAKKARAIIWASVSMAIITTL